MFSHFILHPQEVGFLLSFAGVARLGPPLQDAQEVELGPCMHVELCSRSSSLGLHPPEASPLDLQ